MLAETLVRRKIPLPRSWNRRVKSVVLQVFREPIPATVAPIVHAHRPNHLCHIDVTAVPTRHGFWVPWRRAALPQEWPFCQAGGTPRHLISLKFPPLEPVRDGQAQSADGLGVSSASFYVAM